MTFNPNLPLASQKIRIFPGDVTTNNWPTIKANITTDHNFADTPAGDSTAGYHETAHWITTAGSLGDGTPAAIADTGQLYTKEITYKKQGGDAVTRDVLCFLPGNAAAAAHALEEVAIGGAPVRASVSVTVNGIAGSVSIQGAAFNVSSVSYSPIQVATLTFVENMPTTDYQIIATSSTSSLSRGVFIVTSDKTASTCKVQIIDPLGSAITATVDIIVLGGWPTS